jgi:mannose-6-phosphate isomerase-like protein (cupin superfamily)
MEKTIRGWGYYEVIQDSEQCKIKELVVEPNRCLSYQKHHYREEHWFVKSGNGILILNENVIHLKKHDYVSISKNSWHQLINGTNENLIIIEIQAGLICEEKDIERR